MPCEISVMFTDDEGIREINREFRGIDAATDVLSFPLNDLRPGAFDPDDCGWDYDREAIPLGDMVLSLERCAAQAAEYGHSERRECGYLLTHGLFHLMGYDHMTEAEKPVMRAMEEKALASIGLTREE